MPKLRIGREVFPNTNSREYHTTFELINDRIRTFEKPLPKSLDETGYRKLTKKQKDLIKGLFALPGVIKIYFEPYSVTIIKAEMFDWDEIEGLVFPDGPVVTLLKEFSGDPAGVEALNIGPGRRATVFVVKLKDSDSEPDNMPSGSREEVNSE